MRRGLRPGDRLRRRGLVSGEWRVALVRQLAEGVVEVVLAAPELEREATDPARPQRTSADEPSAHPLTRAGEFYGSPVRSGPPSPIPAPDTP